MIALKWGGGEKSTLHYPQPCSICNVTSVSTISNIFPCCGPGRIISVVFCACCYLLFFSILDTVRFLSGAWLCGCRFAWIQCDRSKPFGGARAPRGRMRGNCQQFAVLNTDRYYSRHLTVPDFQLYNDSATVGIPAAQLLSYFKISLSTVAWIHSAPKQIRTRVMLNCCADPCFLPCFACPYGRGCLPSYSCLAGFLGDRLCLVCVQHLALDPPAATKCSWNRNKSEARTGDGQPWWGFLSSSAPWSTKSSCFLWLLNVKNPPWGLSWALYPGDSEGSLNNTGITALTPSCTLNNGLGLRIDKVSVEFPRSLVCPPDYSTFQTCGI